MPDMSPCHAPIRLPLLRLPVRRLGRSTHVPWLWAAGWVAVPLVPAGAITAAPTPGVPRHVRPEEDRKSPAAGR